MCRTLLFHCDVISFDPRRVGWIKNENKWFKTDVSPDFGGLFERESSENRCRRDTNARVFRFGLYRASRPAISTENYAAAFPSDTRPLRSTAASLQQWCFSTGSKLGELLSDWTRRATNLGPVFRGDLPPRYPGNRVRESVRVRESLPSARVFRLRVQFASHARFPPRSFSPRENVDPKPGGDASRAGPTRPKPPLGKFEKTTKLFDWNPFYGITKDRIFVHLKHVQLKCWNVRNRAKTKFSL